MSEQEGTRRHVAVVEKTYQFLLWLVPTLEKFPRSQKFQLADRIQAHALDVLENLVEASYTRQPAGLLAVVNLRLETLRFLVRLAKDPHQPGGTAYPSPSQSFGTWILAWPRSSKAESRIRPEAPPVYARVAANAGIAAPVGANPRGTCAARAA